MASDRKRRKTAKQARKPQSPPAGPFRHPDGDRRRRFDVRKAYRNQELLRTIGLPPPADDSEE